MAVAASASTRTIPPFPAAEIEARLRDELIAAVQHQAGIQGQVLPTSPEAVLTVSIEIDSLLAVESLCVLDDLLPFELTESVVRAGGYTSIHDAITHLMPRIERAWRRYHGGRA